MNNLKTFNKTTFNKSANIRRLYKKDAIALPITLVMLAAMMLISAGLYRSVEATGVVVNNISLKEAGLQAAEQGIAEAVTWVGANQSALTTNNSAAGYYAAAPDIMVSDAAAATKIDFTGQQTTATADDVNWNGGGTNYYSAKKLSAKVSGFDVAYIIHRLCSTTGNYDANTTIVCSTAATTSSASANGDIAESSEYGNYKITGTTRIAYRVTAKAWGPKGSASYLQTKVLVQYN